MAVNSGINAQGTTFGISVDGVAYTQIGCITNWDWSQPSKNEIDTTCLTDTTKTFRFGLKDNGTVSLDLFYDRGAGMVLAEASYDADTPYYFEVVYSDVGNTTKTFQGYVVSLNETGGTDDVINASMEIRISGAVTEA